MPLMACSSGEATVSAMVFGFAPGYTARTTTVGGTTSGYSLMGNRHSESAPTMKIISDSTPAKIGRLMKKWENFMARSVGGGGGGVVGRLLRGLEWGRAAGDFGLRGHGHAGADALQTVDDDLLAGLEAGAHDAFALHQRAQFHRAIRHR